MPICQKSRKKRKNFIHTTPSTPNGSAADGKARGAAGYLSVMMDELFATLLILGGIFGLLLFFFDDRIEFFKPFLHIMPGHLPQLKQRLDKLDEQSRLVRLNIDDNIAFDFHVRADVPNLSGVVNCRD